MIDPLICLPIFASRTPESQRHPWRQSLFRASVPENPVLQAECQELLASLHSHIRTGLLPDSGWFSKIYSRFLLKLIVSFLLKAAENSIFRYLNGKGIQIILQQF